MPQNNHGNRSNTNHNQQISHGNYVQNTKWNGHNNNKQGNENNNNTQWNQHRNYAQNTKWNGHNNNSQWNENNNNSQWNQHDSRNFSYNNINYNPFLKLWEAQNQQKMFVDMIKKFLGKMKYNMPNMSHN